MTPEAAAPKTTPKGPKTGTVYRIYHMDDTGILTPRITIAASTPQQAIKNAIGEDLDLRGPQRFVAIPERNITEMEVMLKTETKVVFT
jgi:hypothetical protein